MKYNKAHPQGKVHARKRDVVHIKTQLRGKMCGYKIMVMIKEAKSIIKMLANIK